MSCRVACVLALVVGCQSNDTKTQGPIVGTLQIEVLDTVEVSIDRVGTEAMKVSVTSAAGFGLLPAGQTLEADGFVESVVETGDTLYTAKLAAPADPSGPCGDQPVSLAFSLHRQGDNPAVLGGISVYCGADTWFGVPARVLRLAGPLPLP